MVHHQHQHRRKRTTTPLPPTTILIILVITIAITTTTVVTAQSTTKLYYPNWSGGTNNCLLDCSDDVDPSSSNENCTPRPEYMDTSNNLMKGTLKECCNSYYWWDLNVCLASQEEEESGDGLVNDGGEGGTQVWYADYTNFKCTLQQQNDDITTTATVNNNNETLFDSAENCCIDQFPYLALGMCLSHSNGELIYEGSKMYYVDYTNGRYVRFVCFVTFLGGETYKSHSLTLSCFLHPHTSFSSTSNPASPPFYIVQMRTRLCCILLQHRLQYQQRRRRDMFRNNYRIIYTII